ncbi:MAG: tail protein X [Desulfuromonas sp.]|nr:tail protein X [Desulfuromonas sp.]
MAVQYRTSDGDMLDAICHKHYGRAAGAVELVLEANPGLAQLGPQLEAGIVITLPELPEADEQTVVRLWD